MLTYLAFCIPSSLVIMSTKKTLVIIIITLVIVLVVWYLSYIFIRQPQQGASNAIDTTTNIQGDLNQIPDDSSINKEMNTLDQDLKNF